MADIARLGFSVDTSGLVRAERDLDKLGTAGNRAEKSIGGVGSAASGASSAFKAMGGIMAGLGLATVATDALNTYRSFESMNASLKTMTGSASNASAAFAEIQKFAATTPYTLDQSVQGFIKLKALGLDPSMAALKSYGNTASAMGKDLMQMIEAVADASTGEFERLKEFGIKSKSEGDKVTFTFQGVETTVQKSSAAIEGYLQNIGNTKFGTAMSDQAETLNGKISNLQDSWAALQVSVIQNTGVADVAKASISGLADSLSGIGKFVSSAATEWAFFKDSLQFSDDTTFVVLREIGGIFASIGDAIAPVTPYLTEFGLAFAATGVALAVGSVALSAAGAAFALLTSPITLTVAAIAGLIVAGKALYENWDLVTAKFGELAAWWSGTTFDEKILDIETTALETAESLSTAFFDWWDNSALKPIALEIQAAAIDYAQQAAQAFGAWWDSWTLREVTADVTADLLIWAWEKAQAFAAWWDSWTLTPKPGSVDTSLIEKAWGYVQSFVDWWNSISLKDLAGAATSALNSVKSIGSDIVNGLADGINRATAHIGAAKKAAGAVESTMRKELDTHSPSRVMAKIGSDVVDGLAQGIDKNATKAEKEAAKLAEKAAKAAAKEVERINGIMGKAATDMTALSIQYNQGDSAAEIFLKEQDGMTAAQARATVALEDQSKKLKDLIKDRKAANDAYDKHIKSIDDEHAKLTLTADEYERYKLKIDGVVGAKADEIIAREQAMEKASEEQKLFDGINKKLEEALVQTITNGKADWGGLIEYMIQEATRLLVIKPLLESLTSSLSGGGGGGGLGSIFSGIGNWIGGLFGGGRANGGTVYSDKIHPINERGVPEVVTTSSGQYLMNTDGRVSPLTAVTPMAAGGGGGGNISVVLNAPLTIDARGADDNSLVQLQGQLQAFQQRIYRDVPALVRQAQINARRSPSV